jgi:hypothetical protein
LDNPNINFSNIEDGQPLNLDNISFKGAEIADLIGLDLENQDDREHTGGDTLNFSFNKDNSGPVPAFGGGSGSGANSRNNINAINESE